MFKLIFHLKVSKVCFYLAKMGILYGKSKHLRMLKEDGMYLKTRQLINKMLKEVVIQDV